MSSDSDDQSLVDLLDMQRRSRGPVAAGEATTPLRATLRLSSSRSGGGGISRRGEDPSARGESAAKHRAETSPDKNDKQQQEVVETEQMGFRLANEIVQLREKVTKWKELHKSAELQVSSYANDIKDLEERNASLDSAIQGCRSEISKLHEEIRRLERQQVR
jgi:chromosome segregation ATPase